MEEGGEGRCGGGGVVDEVALKSREPFQLFNEVGQCARQAKVAMKCPRTVVVL